MVFWVQHGDVPCLPLIKVRSLQKCDDSQCHKARRRGWLLLRHVSRPGAGMIWWLKEVETTAWLAGKPVIYR